MIDFLKFEEYDTSKVKVIPFLKKTDVYLGKSIDFGNMSGGYPVIVGKHSFPTIEHAYIAGAFSLNTTECVDIQEQISKVPSAMMAKRQFRKGEEYKKYQRTDFDSSLWHYNWMHLLVWIKCRQNLSFRKLLLDIPDDYIIIENEPRKGDYPIWGCINKEVNSKVFAQKKILEKSKKYNTQTSLKEALSEYRLSLSQTGIWRGYNVQGKIIMECARALKDNTEPDIDYQLLQDAEMYWFGQRMNFI